jgi:hypothetical protein
VIIDTGEYCLDITPKYEHAHCVFRCRGHVTEASIRCHIPGNFQDNGRSSLRDITTVLVYIYDTILPVSYLDSISISLISSYLYNRQLAAI